jgi:predicted esterase
MSINSAPARYAAAWPSPVATSGFVVSRKIYGDADTTLDEAIYKEGESLLETHGIPHETIRFSGGHEINAESLVRVRNKLLSS